MRPDSAAVRCELDRIGQQVEYDLLDFPLVAVNVANYRIDIQTQRDAMLRSTFTDHGQATLERVGNREAGDVELHLTGFDL
jgi:hypothetical protein